MKFLLDQNLSPRLVAQLRTSFPASAHVRDVDLAAADDLADWNYARSNGFEIVSKDADFHQRSFLLGHPPRVVWVRMGNCSTDDVLRLLLASLEQLARFEADPDAAFLILP